VSRVNDAWRRWLAAAGPWRGWAVCPCLTVPTIARAEGGLHPVQEEGVPVLDEALREPGTALVIDLEPTLGVAMAARASEQGLAHVVLLLPRWPHADAALPTNALVTALRHGARTLTDTPKKNVVFVLDGERRLTLPHRPTGDHRVDNRYDITAGDLPTLAELRQAGMRRVVKIIRAE